MIEVHELTKRYGSAVAVDGLSFTVHPGRVTGFLGPNGAGKSTTMRVILGLDSPASGWATVSGQPYQRLSRPLRKAGALLEAGAVPGGRTARDHLRPGGQPLDPRAAQVAGRRGPDHLRLQPPDERDGADRRAHLIVIGRGRLVADAPVEEFVQQSSRNDVLVRSPAGGALAGLLSQQGGAATADTDGGLAVTGLDAAAIGGLARAHGITLHELTPGTPRWRRRSWNSPRTASSTARALPADTRKAA